MKSLNLILLVLAPSLPAATTLVNLDFSTLPSTQGFVFQSSGSNSGATEANTFSVNGSSLTQTTVGEALGAGTIRYLRDLSTIDLTGVTNIQLSVRARVTSTEAPTIGSYLSFTNSINIARVRYQFGITATEVRLGGTPIDLPSGFDTSLFHDYRILSTISGSQVLHEVFIDNSLADTVTFGLGLLDNEVSLGDETGSSNSNGERSRFILAVNVPEPSSALLALLGCTTLLRRKR